ncbi:MAG: hypothetical protein SA339_09020 [Methanomassiliicoccus sp.]|nr:hypothetical protein [Methanomassiliicoccus sp.]
MSIATREAGALAIGSRREFTDHLTVRTSIPTLDAFFDGVRCRAMTLIDSSDRMLFDLTHILCVNGVSTLGREVVWIDGGNCVDPYELGRISKRFGLDRTEVLDSVRVARAFTAYQLVSLIDERLEDEVRRTGAGMVIVSCLPDMFQDKEMHWSESYQLIKRCVERLHDLSRREGTATLVTNYGLMKILQRKSLKGLLYGTADDIVRIENAAGCLRIVLPNDQESMLYHPVPHNQTTLEEFMGR